LIYLFISKAIWKDCPSMFPQNRALWKQMPMLEPYLTYLLGSLVKKPSREALHTEPCVCRGPQRCPPQRPSTLSLVCAENLKDALPRCPPHWALCVQRASKTPSLDALRTLKFSQNTEGKNRWYLSTPDVSVVCLYCASFGI
jgi:hypothetical protein